VYVHDASSVPGVTSHPRSTLAEHRPRPASALEVTSAGGDQEWNTMRGEVTERVTRAKEASLRPHHRRVHCSWSFGHCGTHHCAISTEQRGAFRRWRVASSRERHVTAHETVRESAFGQPLVLEVRSEGLIHQLPAIAVATLRVVSELRRRIRGETKNSFPRCCCVATG